MRTTTTSATQVEKTFKSTCKAAPAIFASLFEDVSVQVEAHILECRMYLNAENLIEATMDGLRELGLVAAYKTLSKRQLRLLTLRAQKYARIVSVKQKSS